MINDVVTDLSKPLAFDLGPAGSGPPPFDPSSADEHRKLYGDVSPLIVSRAAAEVYAAALDQARAEGWDIAVSDAAAHRFEAVATTRILRFKDDIALRVSGEDGKARVDMRSRSRVGKSDLGANAKRIEAFLTAVEARLK